MCAGNPEAYLGGDGLGDEGGENTGGGGLGDGEEGGGGNGGGGGDQGMGHRPQVAGQLVLFKRTMCDISLICTIVSGWFPAWHHQSTRVSSDEVIH